MARFRTVSQGSGQTISKGHMSKQGRTWARRQAIKAKQRRVLKNLIWVESTKPPAFANGPRRLTGSSARGKTYETKVATMLTTQVTSGHLQGTLYIGPWFRFEDDNGPGYCQPDALLISDKSILVVEAKLKQTLAAHPQISLYGQLAEGLFHLPWVGVQIFKYPSGKRTENWVDSLRGLQDVVEETKGRIAEMHWLG